MYIIKDKKGEGFVFNSSTEGWIFTTLKERAMKFASEVEAYAVIGRYYNRDDVEVLPLSSEAPTS